MPDRAKVTSIDAIESFRASLIVYCEKARAALDDIGDDVSRTRTWLSDDRRNFWEAEIRRRNRKLEEKQAALFDARLDTFHKQTQAELAAMQKAKRDRDDAMARLEMIKKWSKQFDSRVQPLARNIDKLRDVLVQHMGQAIVHLSKVTNTLSAYAEIAPVDSGSTTVSLEGSGNPSEEETNQS